MTGRGVCINTQVFRLLVVTRYMTMGNAFHRQCQQEFLRIVPMVNAVYIDIVDVHQQVAVCFRKHRVDEVNFIHLARRGCIVRNVFNRYALLEDVLYMPYASGYIADRFLRKGYGHQVVEVAVIAAVAQML